VFRGDKNQAGNFGTDKFILNKEILDACCGSRMFWFDKYNPHVLFQDIRDAEYTLCDGRKLEVHPDVIADFTKMPYADNTFKLVVFDPPHLDNANEDDYMAQNMVRFADSNGKMI